jgi:hypothetical protein
MIDPEITSDVARTSISLGTIIAVVASWERNKSILWAIFHGLLSWVYVIYFALTDRKNNALKTIFYILLSFFLVHILLIIALSIYHLSKS